MKNETEKYYVVQINWVGPDQTSCKHIDFDRYEVTTEPPRNNSDGDIQLSGWLDTDGDVSRYAHGEYPCRAAAEHAIIKLLDGECRRYGEADAALELGVVSLYRPGKYTPMSDDVLGDWLFRAVEYEEVDIPEGMLTPEQAAAVVKELRDLLREDGCDASTDRIRDMLIDILDS